MSPSHFGPKCRLGHIPEPVPAGSVAVVSSQLLPGLSGCKPLHSAQAQQVGPPGPLAKSCPKIGHFFILRTRPAPWALHTRGLRPGDSWKPVSRSQCCCRTWRGEGRELLTYFPWASCHVQAGRALLCQHWRCPCQRGGAHCSRCPGTGLLPFPRAGAGVGHRQVPFTPRAGWHSQGLALQSSDPLHYLNKWLLHQQVPSARPHCILCTGYGQDLAPKGPVSGVSLRAGYFLLQPG